MKELLRSMFSFKSKPRWNGEYLLSLIFSILLALVLGAVIILLTGKDPLKGYSALLNGALGSPRAIGNTLARSATLCLTGLAMAVAAQAGIFNVGGEGQLYLGGMAAAIVGYTLKGVTPFIAIPLAFLAAILAGGLYAYIPAVLKVKRNVSEVITTIMLNSAAIYFCTYLATGPLKTSEKGIASGTSAIDPSFVFAKLVPLSNLTQGIVYAAGLALISWYLMTRTTLGYEMRLTGQNSRFARHMGIPAGKLAIGAMVFSGALCGIVGLLEVYGIHRRYVETLSTGYYFDGMLVAMIMRYQPVGIILMSLFFGALKIGSSAMELNVGISSELVLIIQSIIIFFMAAQGGIMRSFREKRERNRARKALSIRKEGEGAAP